MAVSDLTNTTWVFNNAIGFPGGGPYAQTAHWYIQYTSNSTNYNELMVNYDEDDIWTTRYYNDNPYAFVYAYNYETLTWTNEAYKIISITGGTDATNATLIAWLEANATQQGGGSTAKTQVGTSTIAKKMFGTTPIAKEVVNGVTVYEATPTPSGYSVTVAPDLVMGSSDSQVFVKFNTAPTSSSDYDVRCDYGVLYDRNDTAISSTYSASDITKLYIWIDLYDGEYILNDVREINVGQTYSTANEETLTQNSTLDLVSTYED